MVLMATPAGRRVKGSALAVSLILTACGGASAPFRSVASDCAPWTPPDPSGYQHCVATSKSGNKYDCYKHPGEYIASCDPR